MKTPGIIDGIIAAFLISLGVAVTPAGPASTLRQLICNLVRAMRSGSGRVPFFFAS